jgi:hypothetical protein
MMRIIGCLFFALGICAWFIGASQAMNLRARRLGQPKLFFNIQRLSIGTMNRSEKLILGGAFILSMVLLNIGRFLIAT